jgi:methyltransferase (TIGR00027 family)
MRKHQSSLTALGIAIVRGIESEKPVEVRICYDPYARQFVNPFLFKVVRFFDRIGYSEIKGPGVMGFLTVRERHIDEYLKSCLEHGLEQLVILGAGYDARAYRFEELKHGVKVFEVDHPASQATKLEKLEQFFGSPPAHVVFVPVDFNTQRLDQRLFESGYEEGLKTLFIWQGVTQYLTPESVDATLAFIAGHSGAGSALIFDYMYPTLLDGTIKRGEVANMRGKRWVSGEMMTFGIPEGAVTQFLEQRGFTQVQDTDARILHATYFTGENARRTVAYGYAIASAVVRSKP